MASLFLSYDRDHASIARVIATALEKAGHSVWWDRRIGGGTEYAQEIEQALDNADVVIVLWTSSSIASPWVRDEAGAGRDKGRLVPLSLEGTPPPIGFRQFQSIDLGTWRGRGRVPRLQDILAAIERQLKEPGIPTPVGTDPVRHRRSGPSLNMWALIGLGVTMFFVIVGLLIGRPWELGSSSGPTVSVTAADGSPRSQAAASDLLVKLGGLAQVGGGKWQLVDESEKPGKPDLLFRTADTGSDDKPQSNLVLLDGKSNSLLWSREFTFLSGQQADLRQQLSLTAGRVLGCVLESRTAKRLPRDQLKLFLDACASLADQDLGNYDQVAAQMRTIVGQTPTFRPAWGRLLFADSTIADVARNTGDEASALQQFKTDLAKARSQFPDLPEIAIGAVHDLKYGDFGIRIQMLEEAARRAPDNASVAGELSNALANVGRMNDAVQTAKRSADLDPLSPGGTTNYIMTMAYAGYVDTARSELAKAEKLWAGTGSIREAQVAFATRFGDPLAAMKLDPEGYNTIIYYKARAEPSPANIAKFKAGVDEFRPKTVTSDQVGWAIQGLGEFGLVDDVYYWLGRLSTDEVASISYILFRPALASVRRDPRFMPLASRIGLVRYWQSSGKWPDFCERPGIPYDCKAEAAHLQ